MLIASVVTSVLLICAAIAHFITAFYFRTKVMLQPDEVEPENDYGLASIVMAVRGCDPGLQKALIRLLDQDYSNCLLYTSPSPRDATLSRMPSSA